MLESKLKALRRDYKENVQHNPVIDSADLIKIKPGWQLRIPFCVGGGNFKKKMNGRLKKGTHSNMKFLVELIYL